MRKNEIPQFIFALLALTARLKRAGLTSFGSRERELGKRERGKP